MVVLTSAIKHECNGNTVCSLLCSVKSGNMMKNTKTFFTIHVSMYSNRRKGWEVKYDVCTE